MQQADDHSATFRARTKPLVSSEEVPLLEQINRENEKVVAAAAPSIVRITAVGPVDPHAQIFGDLPFKIRACRMACGRSNRRMVPG